MKCSYLVSSSALIFLFAVGLVGCRLLDRAPTPINTRPRASTPTRQPRPSFTPFRTGTPAPSPTILVAVTDVPSPTGESEPEPVPPTASPVPRPSPTEPSPTETPEAAPVVVPPQPPREGGSWDFENGFFARASGFEGRVDYVGVEWDYFRHRGEHGQGTFNENKNPANVRRGARSQEIAFEASDGDAGIFRTLEVVPKHRYLISAWGIHYPSPSPIELDLGVDLTGGLDSRAATVQWFAWRETGEGKWVYTEETIRATGPQLTLLLRATHPEAAVGGATLLDDIRVIDLGE